MERINHSTAVDIGGGRPGFQSEDTVAGLPGTVVTATHLNAEQEEIMAVIEAAGFAPDGANWKQILGATRSQAANFRDAGGTANALTFSSIDGFEIGAYLTGHPFRFRTGAAANIGACTFKVDDLDPVPLVKRNGAALVKGDLPPLTAFEAIAIAGSVYLLDMVDSDLAASKISFNLQQKSFNARATLSGTGFVTYQTGSYTKTSATSNLVISIATNSFATGSAPGVLRMTAGASVVQAVISNNDGSQTRPAANAREVFSGVGAGALAWTLALGRNDATAWNSVINPTNADATFIPTKTATSVTFEEIEP